MAAVITAIIGHRGSGKSAFLNRARQLYDDAGRSARFVDIDREIERETGRPISQLFPEIGEDEFRSLERRVVADWLERLAGTEEAFVSLGAGFDGDLAEGVAVLWVRRTTDSHGRIFLDRPALDPGLGPLEEFAARFHEREERYRRLADDTYTVPEGCTDPTDADRLVLGLSTDGIGGWLTVLPGDLAAARWDRFLARRLAWGVERLEIRDDLVDPSPLLEAIPPQRLVIGYRTGERWLDGLNRSGVLSDWALELGSPPLETDIVSLHDRLAGESLAAAAARLVAAAPHSQLKLAVEVGGFDELAAGHKWWSADPQNRSFLPRSADGRWAWYRQINRGAMLVNFFREGAGSALDQPTLAEWVTSPAAAGSFAAIVGDPVDHSRTPCEQMIFFTGVPVVRIPLDLVTADILAVLGDIGLTHGAITAPLKSQIFELCDEVVGPAAELGAVNTIARRDGRWVGTNTDLAGVAAAIAHLSPQDTVALWGGGGTRATVLAAVPWAVPHSARTGEVLEGFEPLAAGGPDIVIWAVGRSRQPACQWPPEAWRPSEIIDLNYSEDSPGLEYAWRYGIAYRSGVEMFKAQAAKQREFWNGR